MRHRVYYILIFIFIISCENKQKLNVIIDENTEIKVELYTISEISNSYVHIDLTNKRWNKTELILRGNSEIIDSVYIEEKNIIITSKYENPEDLLYDLTALKYGYKIILKTKK